MLKYLKNIKIPSIIYVFRFYLGYGYENLWVFGYGFGYGYGDFWVFGFGFR